MDEIVKRFLSCTLEYFKFLENENGYEVAFSGIENNNYYPDAQVIVKYINSKMEIDIFWYAAGANIGVNFIDLTNGMYLNDQSKTPKIVNIYTLVDYLNSDDNNLFLLEDINSVTFSKIKKRENIINENMEDIVKNLAIIVKKYARDIIEGDISIFDDVIQYQIELNKKNYPYLFK
jgi:hypothetical protein